VALEDAALALREFRAGKMRGETIDWHGAKLINDCYNSNPAAATSMLEWLSRAPVAGRRGAVLGEMLELGPAGPELHAQVGASARNLDLFVGVRGLAREMTRAAGAPSENFVDTPEAAAEIVRRWIRPGDWVLFKASRGVRLERAIERLQAEAGAE
jgi:UDP-N-acetylmuramoyl-tripeptide--D-alanyl-D-alanine ligase